MIIYAIYKIDSFYKKLTAFNPQIYLGIPEIPTDAYSACLKQQGKRLTSAKLIVEEL